MRQNPTRQGQLNEDRSNEPSSKAPQEDPGGYLGDFALFERRGLKLLLDRTSVVDQVMIGGGGWENAQGELMRQAAQHFLRPDDGAFLDIGAYWGLYAMRAVQAGVRDVHAFEPDPRNFAQLQAQLFLNDLMHAVRVHPCAVSDHGGAVVFRESVKGDNRGSAGIVGDSDEGTIELPCVAVDDLFDWSGRAIVLKLDIEGHEPAALRGMKRLVARNRVFIQVEAFDDTRTEMLAAAGELGLRHIFTVNPIDHYLTNMPPAEMGWFYVAAGRMGLLRR